jgi:hypothetical protein
MMDAGHLTACAQKSLLAETASTTQHTAVLPARCLLGKYAVRLLRQFLIVVRDCNSKVKKSGDTAACRGNKYDGFLSNTDSNKSGMGSSTAAKAVASHTLGNAGSMHACCEGLCHGHTVGGIYYQARSCSLFGAATAAAVLQSCMLRCYVVAASLPQSQFHIAV